MEEITSRTNPLCVRIRKLAASGAYRRENGEFLCDSPKLVREALTWRPDLVRCVVCAGGESPELPRDVRLVRVPADVMETISPAKSPQGVLAVCAIPDQPVPQALEGNHYLVLDGVQDPGNVGTILRTADAFRADGVFLVNACADRYHPKTVRASMGALFRIPAWACGAGIAERLLRTGRIPLYGAALQGSPEDVRTLPYDRAAVAIGSEGRGLSESVLAACDRTVRIPMNERCESLNAAAAATVFLWEMTRNIHCDKERDGMCQR